MGYADMIRNDANPTDIREYLVSGEQTAITVRIPDTLRDAAKEAPPSRARVSRPSYASASSRSSRMASSADIPSAPQCDGTSRGDRAPLQVRRALARGTFGHDARARFQAGEPPVADRGVYGATRPRLHLGYRLQRNTARTAPQGRWQVGHPTRPWPGHLAALRQQRRPQYRGPHTGNAPRESVRDHLHEDWAAAASRALNQVNTFDL